MPPNQPGTASTGTWASWLPWSSPKEPKPTQEEIAVRQREAEIAMVLRLQQMVKNECWRKILAWEGMTDSSKCGGPKVIKYEKVTKYTPKARVNHLLLGHKLPFDRQDWTIDRCGKTVRYIVDFYPGEKPKDDWQLQNADTHGLSMYMDVRPAVEGPGSIWHRIKMWWNTGSGLW
ncbi:cytochrome c/c1 heme lyase-domain-containing protein [Cladochytrium replicatum]|nr:cytochrome c/c1 heme lyase-domain-containing protein [Cladochytrium replicatum]